MKSISHDEQKKIWDNEHKKPHVLKQMHSSQASSGVVKFFQFLKDKNLPKTTGLEMACGKGRNVIWFGKEGINMYGFDFSPFAIQEAKKRAEMKKVSDRVHFQIQDATEAWKYESNFFDFGIDCFGSTDLESQEGRKFAIQEFYRVLKPGGYLLAYLLSTDDEFHKEMVTKSPALERNAFLHPTTGKFEKTFDEKDIAELFGDFKIVTQERLPKTTEFFGKKYNCNHFWIVFQK